MIAPGTTEGKSFNSVVGTPRPEVVFAVPPWDEDDPARQEIEARLPTDHLAMQIDAGVDRLDLSELFASFSGRGSLRARMATPEGKAIYKFRGQTIEHPFADAKEHRGVRRFFRRGLPMAKALIGALVLCHNLRTWHRIENASLSAAPASRTLLKMCC